MNFWNQRLVVLRCQLRLAPSAFNSTINKLIIHFRSKKEIFERLYEFHRIAYIVLRFMECLCGWHRIVFFINKIYRNSIKVASNSFRISSICIQVSQKIWPWIFTFDFLSCMLNWVRKMWDVRFLYIILSSDRCPKTTSLLIVVC